MWRIVLTAVLVAHGLIHLIGFVVPWQLAKIHGIPYRTAIFGGQVELGVSGIRIIGLLWLLACVGFVLAGSGLIWRSLPWWRLAVATAAFSLVLSILGWPFAQDVALIDIAILGVLTADYWIR